MLPMYVAIQLEIQGDWDLILNVLPLPNAHPFYSHFPAGKSVTNTFSMQFYLLIVIFF